MSDRKSTSVDVDVCIIGAGLSGLSAGVALHKAGCKVAVLEARNRVGGRTLTKYTNDGTNCDAGGAYVGPTQNRLLRKLKELGLQTFKVHWQGSNVMFLRGKRSMYSGTIPSLSSLAVLDLNNFMVQSDQLRREIPREAPWQAPHAQEWDNMTLEEWLTKTGWTEDAKQVYRGAAEAVLCVQASEVSFLAFLWYLHCADGPVRAFETNNGAQERKVIGGTQEISVRMAAQLGTAVKLNSPVASIDYRSEHPRVRVTTRAGDVFTAYHVVVALAPALYNKIQFEPILPPLKLQLSQRMPMGSIIKTSTYYKTPFWRSKGLSGTLFSDAGPVIYTYDDCRPADGQFDTEKDPQRPALMGFVLAQQARKWVESTPDERRTAILAQYAKLFDTPEALDAVDYCEMNWMGEEWSGGCYVGTLPPRVLTQFGHVLRQPLYSDTQQRQPVVHFAGTETATRHCGYMDGAIQSGERAAHEILTQLAQANPDLKITKPGVWVEDEPLDPSYDCIPKPTGPTAVEKWIPGVRGVLGFVGAVAVAALSFVVRRWVS